MLSVSQNNICLPARAFKTINKIRACTMATGPLHPPSLPPSLSTSRSAPPTSCIPSRFVLAHLPVQCRHSVVCVHLLSYGKTKPPQQWRTHARTHAWMHKPIQILTQNVIDLFQRRLPLPPANLPSVLLHRRRERNLK